MKCGEHCVPPKDAGSRHRLLITGAIITLVVAAAAIWFVGNKDLDFAAEWLSREQRPEESQTFITSASRIAVFPFSVRGSDEFSYLREGMVDLLSTKLDGAGDLRTVDARALLNRVAREGSDEVDPQVGRAISERFSAGRYVLGDIVAASGRLPINASLYDINLLLQPVIFALTRKGQYYPYPSFQSSRTQRPQNNQKQYCYQSQPQQS